MDPKAVIREYYVLVRRITQKTYKEPQWPSKRLMEQAQAFLDWCAEKEINEPALFLRFRLEGAHRARFMVGFKTLKSEKLAIEWHKWAGEKYRVLAWQERMAGSIQPERVGQIKALRVLLPAMETYQHYQVTHGTEALCMATQEYSGGFHPKSRVCPGCPAAIACANKLSTTYGFDVVALRRGDIHTLPQEVAAAAVA